MPPLTWQCSPADFIECDERDIIVYFEGLPNLTSVGDSVKRLSDTVLAKASMNMDIDEYINQHFAWTLLNGAEVRIPQPYRFFRAMDRSGVLRGYLVMEYIHGQCLEDLDFSNAPDLVEKVARAVFLLHATSSSALNSYTQPGPLSGGLAERFPWGDSNADVRFSTIDDLEECIHRRLHRALPQVYPDMKPQKKKKLQRLSNTIKFNNRRLSLCHLDLAPRNLLLCPDGLVAIIDWTTAAMYPSVFELASVAHMHCRARGQELVFFEHLRNYLDKWITDDDEAIEKLALVHSISIQCHFSAKKTHGPSS